MLTKPQISFAPEGVGSGSASGAAASEPSAPSSGAASAPSSSSTPSGASSTPTPQTPSEARSTPPSGSGTESTDIEFGSDFFAPMSEIEVSEPPAPTDAERKLAPEQEKTVQPPKEEPKAPDLAAKQPPQEPTEQPKAEETRPEADASIPLHEPGRLAESMRQNEKQLLPALAERYKLSPEEIEALETDAASAVPQLLAKAHFNAVVSVTQNLQTMIPAMLQQHLAVYQSAQSNLDKFFSAWPQLDKVKHRDEVLNVAKQYRAINPKVGGEQMIKDVGALVALRVGAPLQAPTAQSGPMSGGGRPPPASPFVPASNGVGAPPSKQEEHPFGGLYEQE